ncbi:MAG: hypothetical protein ACT4OO_10900 [Nitrospiraceae bacterium]
MSSPRLPEKESRVSSDDERRAMKLRRFSSGVTIGMIVLCNTIFLSGLWASGVNLERLIRTPETFNPVRDVCLRLGWMKVVGGKEPVQLCTEWINLADPSGDTHNFQKETQVKQGADGKLYFDHGARVDYRLFVFVLFVAAVVAFGLWLKRHLVMLYRIRLETPTAPNSLFFHQ